jgi:hypothetical protein
MLYLLYLSDTLILGNCLFIVQIFVNALKKYNILINITKPIRLLLDLATHCVCFGGILFA